MYTVYCHKSKTDGRRYIGTTSTTPEKRWKNGIGYKTCTRFYEAIKRYGWEDFEHQIIKSGLTEEEAHILEVELIRKYRTTDPKFGYNMSTGGKGGRTGIIEDPEMTKIRTKGLKGRVLTEEHKRKISESLTGIKRTEETKRKISEAHKGRKHTKEARMRMSDAHKGFKMSEESKCKIRDARRKDMRRVYCVETNTIYESVSSAATALGVEKTNLCATCRGKHKHVGGFHVCYADSEGLGSSHTNQNSSESQTSK